MRITAGAPAIAERFTTLAQLSEQLGLTPEPALLRESRRSEP
jgi:hypothetical protein